MSQSLRECLLLIPCSGLDDFPEALPEADSDEVLSAWLALWHPQLIALTHAAPRWQSANQPPQSFEGILGLAPACAQTLLPSTLDTTATSTGGWLVKPAQAISNQERGSNEPWRKLQAELLSAAGIEPQPLNNDALLLEFEALGYAFLQIQLLTRQLRYTSNLDQTLFNSQLDQAAQAALAGDSGPAETMLQSCFDQLGQERDHYYSLDVSLLDVTLLADTTLGSGVSSQLALELPTTFVASAQLLRKMQAQNPDGVASLQSAVSQRLAALAGGLDIERPHGLMRFDSLKRDLLRGKAAYRQLGFEPPVVFTRFTFGQSSEMPLHLRRSGYAGCMLVAWQEGQYPSGSHAKFSWEASEGTFMNAIAPPLADANSAATYLTLGKRIAEALDHQHVPVFMLAHWPNQYSPYFQVLRRVIKRTPALGKWQNVDDFFDKTDQPYHQEHLPARKFVHDYLANCTGADALIRAVSEYHRLAAQARRLQNVVNLAWQLENYHRRPSRPADSPETEPITNYVDPGPQALPLDQLDSQLAELLERIDSLLDSPSSPAAADAIEKELTSTAERIAQRFAKASGYQVHPNIETAAALLTINPACIAQRIGLTTSSTQSPAAGGTWLYATGNSQGTTLSMIDMPGMSVLPVPVLSGQAPARKREATLVPGEGLLQNDFLETQIDARTGALRSLHVPGKRGNRLSVQLARREKSGSQPAEYSQMQIRELKTIENSTMRGLVRATGVCLFRDQPTANFEIDYELLRGQRILSIAVRLTQTQPLSGSPWNNAYVIRTAWPSEAAILTGRACASRQTFTTGKSVVTELLEIDDVEHRIYLIPSGLAFHQRVEERFMDTILTTGQNPASEYRFGIGVDLPNATATVDQYQQPTLVVPLAPNARLSSDPAKCTAAWLMHVDAKTVLMNLEAPLLDEDGLLAGLRIHVSELAGKSVTARIRALREVREAHRVDYLGGRIAKLTTEGDTTTIALRPNEMTYVDLLWR